MFTRLVSFKDLYLSSNQWYNRMCEPHSGEFNPHQQTVLMAMEFGMPEVLQGDADGACFVVHVGPNWEQDFGMVGTTGLCTLWVTENLELTIVPVAGAGEPFAVTAEQLVAEYALVPVNPKVLEWV